ncbi:PREDICTED: myosin-3-like [Chinchilla lanigera]|uniref:myosin-3-like n=1 Tax=Chinchilla lanigera TaxID=34839 RepID=UPI000695CC4F|nr:PREDICTED: myosin-3-like [Chinchilla lanigera]
MPGGDKGEFRDDVDPIPLLESPKKRTEAMGKPYDIKRSCWITDEKESFMAGEIESEEGDLVVTFDCEDNHQPGAVENLVSARLRTRRRSPSTLPTSEELANSLGMRRGPWRIKSSGPTLCWRPSGTPRPPGITTPLAS